MKKGIIAIVFCVIAFAGWSIGNEPEDSSNFYMDFVRNRVIYTSVSEMPSCNIDLNSYLTNDLDELFTQELANNHVGEYAFVLEPDGSIQQAWVLSPINKKIDIILISRLKQSAKHWKSGKHNSTKVPVEIRVKVKMNPIQVQN